MFAACSSPQVLWCSAPLLGLLAARWVASSATSWGWFWDGSSTRYPTPLPAVRTCPHMPRGSMSCLYCKYSDSTPIVDGGGTDFFTVLSVVDSPLQWTFAHSGLHPYSAAGGGSQMAIWTPIVDYRGHFGVRVAAGSSTVAPVVRLSGSAGLRPVCLL